MGDVKKDTTIPPPIFLIKTDLDPFFLYGHDGDFPGPERDAKVSNALMKTKRLQNLQNDGDHEAHSFKFESKPSEVTDQSCLGFKSRSVNICEKRICQIFFQFEDIFCQIFQHLISASEDPESFLPDGESEVERAEKRFRDFESRLKKSNFELKQQVHILQNLNFKLKIWLDERTTN